MLGRMTRKSLGLIALLVDLVIAAAFMAAVARACKPPPR
jgi:hypothetical protein